MHDNLQDEAADVRAWLSQIKPVTELWSSPFDTGEAIRRARMRRQRRVAVTAGTATVAALALVVPPALAGWHWPHTRAPGPDAASASPTVAVTATPVTAAPPPATRCTLADLPLPDGLAARGVTQPPRVFVMAMDPTGAYVAADAYNASNYAAAVILWHNQVPKILPTGGLGAIMQTSAVNSQGVVAGIGEAPGALGFAWVYRDGVATRLPNLPGYNRLVTVFAVNEAGDVLGAESADSTDHTKMVIWRAAAPGHPEIQTGLADTLELTNAAFAGDGQLFAWSVWHTEPTVWTGDGRRRDLPLPDGFTAGVVISVRGASALGVVFKKLPPPRTILRGPSDYTSVPVRWDLATGRVEVIPGAAEFEVDQVMPAFVTVDVPTGSGSVQGFQVIGGPNDGRTFVLPAATGKSVSPVAVSDDGSLVAGSVGPVDDAAIAGKTRPVLWHC